jgi:CRISPR-associated Cas5-like protein
VRDHLVFVLHGPVAAFGGVAVGEQRGGQARPARSALLGLLAAALGIDRSDAAAHAAMEHGYGVAVRVDAPGVTFSDYHTAQVPPARRGERHATRRAELDARPLETILSRREYRTDSLFTVALWAREMAPVTLADLATALQQPHFLFVDRPQFLSVGIAARACRGGGSRCADGDGGASCAGTRTVRPPSIAGARHRTGHRRRWDVRRCTNPMD